jgi:hypothetical protein
VSPSSGIDLKDSIGLIVAGTIGSMILLACCITVSICYCLKCFCFKNCKAKNRGPKRFKYYFFFIQNLIFIFLIISSYAFRPTTVMQTEIVYPPQPNFFFYINNDGGDVCNKELSGFASPETINS